MKTHNAWRLGIGSVVLATLAISGQRATLAQSTTAATPASAHPRRENGND